MICHSNIAFYLLDLSAGLNCAFCSSKRQGLRGSVGVQTVLLIRHGETDFNSEGRLQGNMPVPLNDVGRRQAQALGCYLRGQHIDALWTSPIKRSLETATIINSYLKLPLKEDSRLREIEFGIFEGYTYEEAKSRYPDAVADWDTSYLAYQVPEGESRQDVQLRMRDVWDEVMASSAGSTVALVTHGSAIALFLRAMFAHPPDEPIPNTSITTLAAARFDLGNRRLRGNAASGVMKCIDNDAVLKSMYSRAVLSVERNGRGLPK